MCVCTCAHFFVIVGSTTIIKTIIMHVITIMVAIPRVHIGTVDLQLTKQDWGSGR